ncbi:tetratricopeptide repeat protein [Psychrosphaera haliotis]|uniref:Tetratricopeptide repeat protein n=1 Tax=Psychrosphaera haliotis TaxID=555083 RepID=A0A6N8FBK8_9GAMM|nr:tetratricopeptide repeat protein [Psychrosphaera haliotis]MUH73668.1 tetratricopeptide repeat protein [Psychrosphaera haliotis]
MNTLHKIAVASLVIAMAGCGQKTTTEHLSDAKQLISEKNFSEATIALKNAAKNAPEDADVRLELASVYLKIGNIEAAEKELMMALDKGADINLVFPTLGHLLFLQNKLEDLESIDLEDVDVNPEVRDQIKFYQLYTLINRSLIDDALTLIAQPNASNSGHAQLIDALALYSKGDTDKSISLTNTLLEEDTDFNDARLVLVKLYTSNNEADKADSVLRVYNENVPYDYRSKLLHARVLIQINNLDDAKKKLTTLQSGRLYSPLQDQMLAQIHYLKGDFETAELNIQNALKNGLSDDFTNSLAGAIFLKTNKPEQALQRLSSVSEKGKTENNQQLLIMALVNVGKDKEAAQLLLEQEKVDDNMVSMMTLSANKLVNQGQSTLALETLLKATAVEDLNVTNAVNLGLLKLRLNDFSGLQDLKTIVEAHPSKAESRLGYVLGLMKARKIDSAKAELNQWLATPGISVNDELLIAKLMLKVNEPDSAIKTLTKLTTVDAVSRDAKIELVRLNRKSDLSQNVRFLSEILEQNPTDKLALQYLASKPRLSSAVG